MSMEYENTNYLVYKGYFWVKMVSEEKKAKPVNTQRHE